MGKIVLYGIAHSRASRCQWVLREIGLDFEAVPVNDRTGETRTAEFLAINPNGKVPVLFDGEYRIVESLAINLYLARRYDGGLWPRTAEGEGDAFQWTLWGLNEVENRVMTYLYARARGDGAAMAGALESLGGPLAVLDAVLADRDYLTEDRFTVADLNAAANFSGAAFFGYDYPGFSRVQGWLRRCFARPAARVPGSTLERFGAVLGV